jgi:hypothetical protein
MVTPETRLLDHTFFAAALALLSPPINSTDPLAAGLGSLGVPADGTAEEGLSFVVESALLESSIQGFSAIPRGGRIGSDPERKTNTVEVKAEQN